MGDNTDKTGARTANEAAAIRAFEAAEPRTCERIRLADRMWLEQCLTKREQELDANPGPAITDQLRRYRQQLIDEWAEDHRRELTDPPKDLDDRLEEYRRQLQEESPAEIEQALQEYREELENRPDQELEAALKRCSEQLLKHPSETIEAELEAYRSELEENDEPLRREFRKRLRELSFPETDDLEMEEPEESDEEEWGVEDEVARYRESLEAFSIEDIEAENEECPEELCNAVMKYRTELESRSDENVGRKVKEYRETLAGMPAVEIEARVEAFGETLEAWSDQEVDDQVQAHLPILVERLVRRRHAEASQLFKQLQEKREEAIRMEIEDCREELIQERLMALRETLIEERVAILRQKLEAESEAGIQRRVEEYRSELLTPPDNLEEQIEEFRGYCETSKSIDEKVTDQKIRLVQKELDAYRRQLEATREERVTRRILEAMRQRSNGPGLPPIE